MGTVPLSLRLDYVSEFHVIDLEFPLRILDDKYPGVEVTPTQAPTDCWKKHLWRLHCGEQVAKLLVRNPSEWRFALELGEQPLHTGCHELM